LVREMQMEIINLSFICTVDAKVAFPSVMLVNTQAFKRLYGVKCGV
jgi:hypothetical protein